MIYNLYDIPSMKFYIIIPNNSKFENNREGTLILDDIFNTMDVNVTIIPFEQVEGFKVGNLAKLCLIILFLQKNLYLLQVMQLNQLEA